MVLEEASVVVADTDEFTNVDQHVILNEDNESANDMNQMMDWFADTNRVSITSQEASAWENVVYEIFKNQHDLNRLKSGLDHIGTMAKFIRLEKQRSFKVPLVNAIVRVYHDVYNDTLYQKCIEFLHEHYGKQASYSFKHWKCTVGTSDQMKQLYRIYRLWYTTSDIQKLLDDIVVYNKPLDWRRVLVGIILEYDGDNITTNVTKYLDKNVDFDAFEVLEEYITQPISTKILYDITVEYDKDMEIGCVPRNYQGMVKWLLAHGADPQIEFDGTTVLSIQKKWKQSEVTMANKKLREESSCSIQ